MVHGRNDFFRSKFNASLHLFTSGQLTVPRHPCFGTCGASPDMQQPRERKGVNSVAFEIADEKRHLVSKNSEHNTQMISLLGIRYLLLQQFNSCASASVHARSSDSLPWKAARVTCCKASSGCSTSTLHSKIRLRHSPRRTRKKHDEWAR